MATSALPRVFAKFDSMGHQLWSFSPGFGQNYTQYVHFDDADDLIIYGEVTSSQNFGGVTTSGSGVLVAKIN